LKERVRDEAIGRIARNASSWYFFYFGLGAFFVGLSSARRLQAAERRASEFERLAHSGPAQSASLSGEPALPVQHAQLAFVVDHGAAAGRRGNDDPQPLDFFRSALAIDPTVDVSWSRRSGCSGSISMSNALGSSDDFR
jgi:hypothetical protein